MRDQENGPFDLFELEQLKNAETEVDKEWRLETRRALHTFGGQAAHGFQEKFFFKVGYSILG